MVTVDLGALRVDVRGFCRLLLAVAVCLLPTTGLASAVGARAPGNDVGTVYGAPSFVYDVAANDARVTIPHWSGSLGDEAPSIERHGVRGLSNAGGGVYDPASSFVAPRTTRFFAGNGPLDEAVAATFRSGTYDEVILSQDTLLYRVYGGEAGQRLSRDLLM